MRNLLSTLVLTSIGLVFSSGDASAFFRKKKKCQPEPVCCPAPTTTYSLAPSYSGSSYSALPSAFPTYPRSNYGNAGYGGYNNSGYGNGPVRGVLGTVGSLGNSVLSAPGNLYNRIR